MWVAPFRVRSFANPASGVSSQVGIDDTTKAPSASTYTAGPGRERGPGQRQPGGSVQTELCAFAEWDEAEWHRHYNMLDNTARWVAEEAMFFGIPIHALTAS